MTGRPVGAGTLSDRVSTLAQDLEGVTHGQAANGFELRRGRTLFAVVEEDAVELRLRPDIAEAVLRTPDTGPSQRGEEWIRFAPSAVDQSVEDRLAAWVTTAWRAAG